MVFPSPDRDFLTSHERGRGAALKTRIAYQWTADVAKRNLDKSRSLRRRAARRARPPWQGGFHGLPNFLAMEMELRIVAFTQVTHRVSAASFSSKSFLVALFTTRQQK